MNRQYFSHRNNKTIDHLDRSVTKKQYSVELAQPKKRSCSKNHQFYTIDSSRAESLNYFEEFKAQATRKRVLTRRLPSLMSNIVDISNPIKQKIEFSPKKKLDIN